jgi:hypothetical protein
MDWFFELEWVHKKLEEWKELCKIPKKPESHMEPGMAVLPWKQINKSVLRY